MAKVTQDDIIKFNKLYAECNNYNEVARRTGFSASTVRKYIKKDFAPVASEPSESLKITVFKKEDIPIFTTSLFRGINNYGALCILTENEKKEMEELWKELNI